MDDERLKNLGGLELSVTNKRLKKHLPSIKNINKKPLAKQKKTI
jgi:hypothetical protein